MNIERFLGIELFIGENMFKAVLQVFFLLHSSSITSFVKDNFTDCENSPHRNFQSFASNGQEMLLLSLQVIISWTCQLHIST